MLDALGARLIGYDPAVHHTAPHLAAAADPAGDACRN